MIGADAVPVASSERKIVNATADRYVQENSSRELLAGNVYTGSCACRCQSARAPRAALARPLR